MSAGSRTGRHQCDPEGLRERALRGDEALVAELFACYSADLVAYLRRRCGDKGDADDAIQDTFEAATRHLATYRGEAPVRSWLYRLAGNACTRMRRGRKNQPSLHKPFDETAQSFGPGPASAAALEAAVQMRLRPLQQALESLGATDRAILLLRDGAEMTAKEVGDSLGMSEAAVKARLHRARKHMRARLAAV